MYRGSACYGCCDCFERHISSVVAHAAAVSSVVVAEYLVVVVLSVVVLGMMLLLYFVGAILWVIMVPCMCQLWSW